MDALNSSDKEFVCSSEFINTIFISISGRSFEQMQFESSEKYNIYPTDRKFEWALFDT